MAFDFPTFNIPAGAVPISPGTNIQSVIDRYQPGTAFLLKAGVHSRQTINPKDGMSFYGEVGSDGTLKTILSGENQAIKAFEWWRGSKVTIRNLIIEKYITDDHVGAIHAGDGWLIEGNEIRNNQKLGIQLMESNATVRANYIHNNGMLGVGATGNNLLIEGNEISFNNTGGYNSNYQGGGLKAGESTNAVVRNNYVHDNDGRGIWFDVGDYGALIENNLVRNNSNEGILYEISYNATIRNNQLAENGRVGGWLYGSQILISSSPDTEVYGNKVEVNAAYGKGIGIIQQDRGSGAYGEHKSRNNQVYNNQIIYRGDSASQDIFNALSGVAQDVGSNEVYSNNRFYNNQYYWPSGISQNRFIWNNRYVDLASFEAGNGESGSTYSNVLPTLSWNWGNSSPSQPSAPPVNNNNNPPTLRIEAEDIDQITGFGREAWVAASDGNTLGLMNGSPNGTATLNFTGSSGRYNIFIGTFDENDGQAQLQLTRNNSTVGSITLDQQLAGNAPSASTKVTRQIGGSGIQLNQGDMLRVIGIANSGEYARLDFIQFVPV